MRDTDPSLSYPSDSRFGLSFDTRAARITEKGLHYYRDGYEELAQKVHGEHAQHYGH